MITIETIRKEEIDSNWDWIEPLISMALEYTMGEYDTDNVLHQIILGQIIVLIIREDGKEIAALTLEVGELPLKRIVNVMTAGGKDMHKWLDMAVEYVDELAREIGADLISIHGRSGWAKALSKHNYKSTYVVLIKEIT